MRIIKKEPDKSVEKRVVCRDGCGATIGYLPNDVKTATCKDISGCSETWHSITCPNCKKNIVLQVT